MQTAQAVHAAFQLATEHPSLVREWHEKSNFLVVLSVPDEAALVALADEAHERFIIREVVFEPDLDDQATAIAMRPGPDAQKLCANLPLALRENAMT